VECKKVEMELKRQKEEAALKQNELKKLDEANDSVKKQAFEKQIE
jgi:hypothetical protein